VTAKRSGMLRSCCGFMGSATTIAQGVQRAAQRTANDDHRFPPISASELPYLDLDVWLLFDPRPITVRGEARRESVVIGQHGLQVVRGDNRGLLLPGVAVEHELDAEQFLQHVCLKASLPPHAWKDDDVQIFSFAGLSIDGVIPADVLATVSAPPASFSAEDVKILSQLCRKNVLAFLDGSTPTPYAFNAADGEARGVAIELKVGGQSLLTASHFAIREGLPVQSTLYGIAEELAKALQREEISRRELSSLEIDLAIFDDVATHGATHSFDARGYLPNGRALLIAGRNKSALVWDGGLSASEALGEAMAAAMLNESDKALVYSASVAATTSRLVTGNQPRPQRAAGARPPAMAGTFYPADPSKLNRLLEQLLAGPPVEKRRYPAIMVPHAGLKYSGKTAADVLRRVEFPSTIIVVGPKHTPHGVDWAVAPNESWSIPGATLSGDPQLARELVEAIPELELDAAAHAKEHAIEVELPFLAKLAPNTKVVGITIGPGDYPLCKRIAAGLAKVLRRRVGQASSPAVRGTEGTAGGDACPTKNDQPLLVISTDMNHFASDAENRRLDELALQCIERLDAESLLATCRKNHISMCGVLPAVIVMETLRELGQLHRAQRIGYATSADATGDASRVVGYAGVVFE